MTDNEKLLIAFANWLKTRGIKLLHTESLTTPTDKGLLYLVEDFLEQHGE